MLAASQSTDGYFSVVLPITARQPFARQATWATSLIRPGGALSSPHPPNSITSLVANCHQAKYDWIVILFVLGVKPTVIGPTWLAS